MITTSEFKSWCVYKYISSHIEEKSWSIKELSTWIKVFDNSLLNELLPNQPSDDEIREAKRVLKNKRIKKIN